jgi:lysophospholipase L1-like esterase
MLMVLPRPSLFLVLIAAVWVFGHGPGADAADTGPIDESSYTGTIRVACIGDSITAGVGASSDKHFYPYVLGTLLGPKYEVRNFGVSATTLLSHGDLPYIAQGAWKAAKEFLPQVVTIKLGTNDSKANGNYAKVGEMPADLTEMVTQLQALPSKPRVFLCLPCYIIPPGNYSIDEGRMLAGIIPAITKVAKAMHLTIIDLHTPTKAAAEKDPHLIPDRVHPGDAGYVIIADTIYTSLTGKSP